MKRIVEVTDASGFEAALGEQVLLLCANYFYTGKLSGVNETHLELTEASIVYETGPWNQAGFSDAQKLPKPINIQTGFVESWIVL